MTRLSSCEEASLNTGGINLLTGLANDLSLDTYLVHALLLRDQ